MSYHYEAQSTGYGSKVVKVFDEPCCDSCGHCKRPVIIAYSYVNHNKAIQRQWADTIATALNETDPQVPPRDRSKP